MIISKYNFINLPSVVSGALGAVTYSFNADGTKVAVEDNSGNGYQYMGSLIYAKSGSTLTLESAMFAHGYIAPQDGQVYYHTTDHLGSVRAITNMQGSVVERNGYYPFGSETALGSSYPKLLDNRMKFNGKEVQTTGNLGLLDYGARMYDPAIGRWTAQDPLSEKYYSWSQYNYCVNNPVMFVDPDGKAPGPGDLFQSPDAAAAAVDWGKHYNGLSIINKTEMISIIYKINIRGSIKYTYSIADTHGKHGGTYNYKYDKSNVAIIHSHGNYDGFVPFPIALPNLMPLISKAKATEAQQQLVFLHSLQKSYFYTNSLYSESLEEIGFIQEPLVTDGGKANYLISIEEVTENGFRAVATAVVDFNGNGILNVWEINENKDLTEIVKD